MLTGPVEGRFLELLVFATGARRVLEIGTYSGYSALSMAAGLPEGGHIDTCELDQKHAEVARRYIGRSPFADRITVHVGPAIETVSRLDGPYDLVFVDADKVGYDAYYEAVSAQARAGRADRVRQHAPERARRRGSRLGDNTRAIVALNDKLPGRFAGDGRAADRARRGHARPQGLTQRLSLIVPRRGSRVVPFVTRRRDDDCGKGQRLDPSRHAADLSRSRCRRRSCARKRQAARATPHGGRQRGRRTVDRGDDSRAPGAHGVRPVDESRADPRLPEANRSLNPLLSAVIETNPRRSRSPRSSTTSGARARPRPAARHSDSAEGQHRHRRQHADDGRVAGARRQPRPGAMRDRRQAPRRRRGACSARRTSRSGRTSAVCADSTAGARAAASHANPYLLSFDPCGSSSGSAVAPAANLCAGAVGTETDGSIVCPAGNNLVVGLKPTLGLLSQDGIIPIAHSQDTAGPMARTVTDVAILLGAMQTPFGPVSGQTLPSDYTRSSNGAPSTARGSASTRATSRPTSAASRTSSRSPSRASLRWRASAPSSSRPTPATRSRTSTQSSSCCSSSSRCRSPTTWRRSGTPRCGRSPT